jgi:hypothetical protein
MSRRPEFLLAALLATAVLIAVYASRRSPRPTEENEPPSTYLSGPNGSKAVYEVMARLGQPQVRRRTPLFELSRDERHRPALLAVVAVPISLQAAEVEQVVRYLRSGGELLAVGRGGGLTRCLGWVAARSVRKFRVDSLDLLPPSPGLVLPRVVRYLERPDSTADELPGSGCATLVPVAQDTLIRALDHRPVILRLRYRGGGRATLVADPVLFRNRAWKDGDAGQVLAPLLRPEGRGRLAWDEYHHGFGGGSSVDGAVVSWLGRSPAGWAILQLCAVALVALAVAAVRFGPARGVIERKRRSPLEHLEALAAGLESAAGVETAVALTVSGLRRRLSRTGYAPARGDTRGWLAALELAIPTPKGRAAIRRLQQLTTHPGGGERVLAAAQAVEDVWQELRPRTTRDAS